MRRCTTNAPAAADATSAPTMMPRSMTEVFSASTPASNFAALAGSAQNGHDLHVHAEEDEDLRAPERERERDAPGAAGHDERDEVQPGQQQRADPERPRSAHRARGATGGRRLLEGGRAATTGDRVRRGDDRAHHRQRDRPGAEVPEPGVGERARAFSSLNVSVERRASRPAPMSTMQTLVVAVDAGAGHEVVRVRETRGLVVVSWYFPSVAELRSCPARPSAGRRSCRRARRCSRPSGQSALGAAGRRPRPMVSMLHVGSSPAASSFSMSSDVDASSASPCRRRRALPGCGRSRRGTGTCRPGWSAASRRRRSRRRRRQLRVDLPCATWSGRRPHATSASSP